MTTPALIEDPSSAGTMKVSLTSTTPAATDLRGGRFFEETLSRLHRRLRYKGNYESADLGNPEIKEIPLLIVGKT